MDKPEIKYVLDQASTEIEQARSWPTKVMAFYVAINFGLVGALIALKNNTCALYSLPPEGKAIVTVLLSILALWVIRILIKNHKNYLIYRNLQILLQQKFLTKWQEKLKLPKDWFKRNEVCTSTRFLGWGLYLYIVVMVASLVIAGIWLVL